MTAAEQPRPATLYDAVHAALLSLANRLPGEPKPVLLAWSVDPLAEKVTEHVEASGFLTDGYDALTQTRRHLGRAREQRDRALNLADAVIESIAERCPTDEALGQWREELDRLRRTAAGL